MKLQVLHEAQYERSARIPLLTQLHSIMRQVKPDATQEDVINFVAYVEARNMEDNMGTKDFIYIVKHGFSGIEDNPEQAEDLLSTFVSDEFSMSVDEQLEELIPNIKTFFGIHY